MKKSLFVLAASIFICFAAQGVCSQHWYDRYGEVPLQIDSSKVTIQIDPEIPVLHLWTYLGQLSRIET